MELDQKRRLYMREGKEIREYNATDIVNIDDSGILFSDGFSLDFMECRNHFPIDHPYFGGYIGARLTGEFWQFFVKDISIIILCENLEESLAILSHIGFLNSFDLS